MPAARRNIAVRLATAAIAIPLVLAINYVGGWLFAITLGLVAVLATHELLQMERRAGYSPFMLVGLLGSAVLVAAPLFVNKPQNVWIGVVVAVILLSGFYFLIPSKLRGARSRTGATDDSRSLDLLSWSLTVMAPLVVGLLLGHLGLLRHLHRGAWWVALVLLVTWAYDTGAFVTGSYFGKRPFMSHVSPSKTVEGLIGGLAVSTLIGLIGVPAIGLYVWQALLVGFLGGIAAQVGDLLESMVKRQSGVKDSGTLVPGHGGLLDRIDSLLVVSPAVAYLALWFSYAT